MNAVAGAGTYDFINTGPVGPDVIKVAFIYKPGSVTPVGTHAILDSSVDPTFLDTKNRPALAQTFEQNGTGEMFTAVINHLKSKGSDCLDVGDPDTGDGQGNCNLTRTTAAAALANWLATDPTSSGDPDFLIIGDLNAYAMEDPITALKNAGYTNLVEAFNGLNAYSFVFFGQAGYLDHALANPALTPQVTGVVEWHINADEPSALDYNDFNQTELYHPDPYRASDHDPIIVGLNLESVVPGSPDVVYVSGRSHGSAGGMAFADEDIMAYDRATGQWSLYFDGSDVGLRRADIDALHVMDDGAVLISFNRRFRVRELGKVDDSDIIKFTPTSLGQDTDGSFEWFFDGSDVGLTRSGEDVDGIGFTPDGRLVISVSSSFKVRQTGGGKLRGYDDDLIVFNSTAFGKHTRGDWELYFDGSDVWHHSEDIGGLWLDSATGDIYVSMKSKFTAGGASGDELDIFICHPDSLGHDTACTIEPGLYFDGSAAGFNNDRIDGFSIGR